MRNFSRKTSVALSLLSVAATVAYMNHTSTAHASLSIGRPLSAMKTLDDSARYVSTALHSVIGELGEVEQESKERLEEAVRSARANELHTAAATTIREANNAYALLEDGEISPVQAVTVQQCAVRDLMTLLIEQKNLINSLPSEIPCQGRLTSEFGTRVHPISRTTKHHDGIDVAARSGTEITAPAGGTVVFAGRKSGYGNVVEIDHGFGYRTLYGHASRLLVKEGARVARGEKIALVGSTGASTGSHLHYEVTVDGVKVDPIKFMDATVMQVPMAAVAPI